MLRPGSMMISAAGRQVLARGADQRVEVVGDRRRLVGVACSGRRARRRGRRPRTRRARRAARRDSANGSTSRICEPTWTCRPRMRSRGLRSIRAISCAASAGSSPNFEPAWPVSTCACVSAVTPGITRTSTSCARPAHGRLEPVDVVGVVDHDEPDPVLDRHRDLLVALGVAVVDDQRRIDAGLQRGQDLAAAGDVEPEALLDHHALDGGGRERLGGEHDARARPARGAARSTYSRARARSAGSATTSAGVPNSAASVVGAAAADAAASRRRRGALPGGKSESRSSTAREAIDPASSRRLRGKSKPAAASSPRRPVACRAMSVLDRFRLDGKVAVVTGASSGLGAAFAVGLAEAGADVAIGARRADRLQQTAEQVEALGRRCLAVTADVSLPEDCTRVVEETVARARPRRRAGQQRRHRHRRPRHARDAGRSSAA